MSSRRSSRILLLAAAWLALGLTRSEAETLELAPGRFFGPGDLGVHRVRQAQVRNITLTAPLTGEIPFFNNGADLPNVIAEVLQDEIVDGLTSNGVPINENIDTALFLDLQNEETGESARLMVVAVAGEQMRPDSKGNLTFNPSVIADPGAGGTPVPFKVTFTTGARRIPLSLKTQHGEPGGHDNAGPFPSGRFLIGRLGDFDQDGFLDGILVQAEDSPLELIAARGDPIAQRRPWSLAVPIAPQQAALLALNGIIQNFPEPLSAAAAEGDRRAIRAYLGDLKGRLPAILGNLARAVRQPGVAARDKLLLQLATLAVSKAQESINGDAGNPREIAPTRVAQGFQLLAGALLFVVQVGGALP